VQLSSLGEANSRWKGGLCVTAGATAPLAWAAIVAALLGITGGTLYQKRFGGRIDWRPALCIQYAATGLLFALGALAFETGIVADDEAGGIVLFKRPRRGEAACGGHGAGVVARSTRS